MATKKFGLNVEPHVAEIGDDVVLEFRPAVMGDESLDVYEVLQGHLKSVESDEASGVGSACPGVWLWNAADSGDVRDDTRPRP